MTEMYVLIFMGFYLTTGTAATAEFLTLSQCQVAGDRAVETWNGSHPNHSARYLCVAKRPVQ
jgi:hypothetical protein